MKRLIPLVAMALGVLAIANGLRGGVPAQPQSAYEWGRVVGLAVGVTMVLLALLWVAQGHYRFGWWASLAVLVIASGLTVGLMRWRGSRPPRLDCDAALDNVRALYVAGDPGGAMVRRFDKRRPAMKERCASVVHNRERLCILAARSIIDLQSCPRW